MCQKNIFPQEYSHDQTVKFCDMFICRRQTQNAVRKSHIQAKNAYLPEEFRILKLQLNPLLSHFLQEPTIFF